MSTEDDWNVSDKHEFNDLVETQKDVQEDDEDQEEQDSDDEDD
jgi:hypothetical protein